jgi:hypothetical protein
VRFYAEPGLIKRMTEAGFAVTTDDYVKSLDTKRLVLNPAEMIYRGKK